MTEEESYLPDFDFDLIPDEIPNIDLSEEGDIEAPEIEEIIDLNFLELPNFAEDIEVVELPFDLPPDDLPDLPDLGLPPIDELELVNPDELPDDPDSPLLKEPPKLSAPSPLSAPTLQAPSSLSTPSTVTTGKTPRKVSIDISSESSEAIASPVAIHRRGYFASALTTMFQSHRELEEKESETPEQLRPADNETRRKAREEIVDFIKTVKERIKKLKTDIKEKEEQLVRQTVRAKKQGLKHTESIRRTESLLESANLEIEHYESLFQHYIKNLSHWHPDFDPLNPTKTSFCYCHESFQTFKKGEISIKEHDLIEIQKKPKKGLKTWRWKGTIKNKTGWFPAARVTLIQHDIVKKPEGKQKPPKPKISRKINWKFYLIFEIDPEETSRQLTIAEQIQYIKIQPAEFHNQSWNKEGRHHYAKNLRDMITRFNHISYWVSTLVIQPEDVDERISRFEYFIEVACHLRKIANFNTLMAFLSGLTHSSIHRMRITVESISQESEDKFQELDSLMESEKSYGRYRSELKEQELCIPFLGVHLTDITFLEDDIHAINGIIAKLCMMQEHRYCFKPVAPLQTYFETFSFLSDEALYKFSNKREPKGCTEDEIRAPKEINL